MRVIDPRNQADLGGIDQNWGGLDRLEGGFDQIALPNRKTLGPGPLPVFASFGAVHGASNEVPWLTTPLEANRRGPPEAQFRLPRCFGPSLPGDGCAPLTLVFF